jgi:hypothetical protein
VKMLQNREEGVELCSSLDVMCDEICGWVCVCVLCSAASWDHADGAASSASDLFLLSTNLQKDVGQQQPNSQLHANLFSSYQLQSIGQPGRAAQPSASPAGRADDLNSLLSRLSSSRHADLLSSGNASLADFEDAEFDTSAINKMVDEFAAGDDEEEVAAAQSAAEAWGPVPASYNFDAFSNAQPSSKIPAPGAAPAPLPAPQSTPTKGAMSLADLEAKLRSGVAPSEAAPITAAAQQAGASENPALAGLPAALHQLVLSGQTAPLQPGQSPPGMERSQTGSSSTYSGPPLPHFQHGAPAPQGLSVDDRDRQHFYIPLPKSHHGLGFMTKSEIALVFRIQLSQLQNVGDPLSDGQYYMHR